MTDVIQKMRAYETMWYPSCGNDFRPIHHVAFNNFYIDPSVLIFNDIDQSIEFTVLTSIGGVEIITQNTINRHGVDIRCFKIKVTYGGRNRIKEMFFFQLSNREMFDFLIKYRISPSTLLLHRLNDLNTPMEMSWIEAMQILRIEYCYTDNWFNLTLLGESTFRKELIDKSIRFISKQSYSGFDLRKIRKQPYKLAINNCFDSTIYLFQINSLSH
jgi:hypothetical protein